MIITGVCLVVYDQGWEFRCSYRVANCARKERCEAHGSGDEQWDNIKSNERVKLQLNKLISK